MRLSLRTQDQRSSTVQRKRWNRRVCSRRKRESHRKGEQWKQRRSTARIRVPHAINIEATKNRRQFTSFMSEFRKSCLQSRSKIVLDFSEAQVALPAAMLLLIAEIDRAKRILKSEFSVQFSNVKDRTIKQLLIQLGFYELCNQTPPNIDKQDFKDNVRHWRFATSERADEDASDAFAAIEGHIAENLRGGMWKGVSEAIVNSVQHAYAAPRGTPGPRMNHKRWWMFSQENKGKLTVAVCDLGIGIPRSLPLNWDERLLGRIFGTLSTGGTDLTALQASLELGRTSTGRKHRGKGLPQIWNAVRADPDARILIHSNRARLSSVDGLDKGDQFDDSIFGTVVIWTVPLAPGAPT